MEEITRRSILTALAVAPVVAKVSIDDLDEDEVALLTLAARDFSDARVGHDKKTMRNRWDIDPAKYPTFGKGSKPLEILESMATRGLVELKDAYGVLPDGREVDQYYIATTRGREVLARHLA